LAVSLLLHWFLEELSKWLHTLMVPESDASLVTIDFADSPLGFNATCDYIGLTVGPIDGYRSGSQLLKPVIVC